MSRSGGRYPDGNILEETFVRKCHDQRRHDFRRHDFRRIRTMAARGGPVIPTTEVTTQTVRAADDATAQIRLHRRLDDPSAPVLICMPAMGTPAASYAPLANALAEAGFQVVVGELRGQGTSSVRAGRGVRYGYHEIVTYDYPAVFRAVQDAFPGTQRYLVGHSLGGQLGLLYLSQAPRMAAGAILVGAPSCHYRGWAFPKNLGVLVGAHLAVATTWLFGFFPGKRIGLLGNESAQTIRDLAAQVRTGRYRVPSSEVDFERLLSRIALPILAVTILDDDLAPSAAIRGLCAKLTSAAVSHWHLVPGASARRKVHYSWIRDNTALVDRVRRFVRSHPR